MSDNCDCDKPNYGHLHTDAESGLDFILQLGTGKRLFKHPPCRFCESAHYSLSSAPKDNCGCLSAARVGRNDNE